MLLNILVGFIAGLLAKALTSGERGEPSGWLLTIILGMVGGFVGGWLFSLVGIHAYGILGQIIISTVGAIVVISLVRYIKRQ